MKRLIFIAILLCFIGSSYAVAVGLSYNNNVQCFAINEEKIMYVTLSGVMGTDYDVDISENNVVVADIYDTVDQTKVKLLVNNNIRGNYSSDVILCINPSDEGQIRNCAQANLKYEIRDSCVVEQQVKKEKPIGMFLAGLIIFLIISYELIRE